MNLKIELLGWYNDVTLEIYKSSDYNYDIAVTKTKELINERLNYFLHNPKEFLSYYSEKFTSTWTNPTFQTMWCSLPGNRYNINEEYSHYLGYHTLALDIEAGTIKNYIEEYFKVYSLLIFILAGLSIINIAKNYKEYNEKYLLIPITFSCGLLFHMIWETKALYVIQYYFLLLPYTAFGIIKYEEIFKNKLIQKIKLIKEKNKTKD